MENKTNGKRMKAILIKDYVKDLVDIRPSTVPVPQSAPFKSQSPMLLIRICFTSPTHVDTLYARGLHQNNHSKLVHPPFILGMEFTGYIEEIVEVGHASNGPPRSSTTNAELRVGDRVWGAALGSFAPYVVVPASAVSHVPRRLSLSDAAGLGASTAPVSYGALIRLAKLRKGETCLVHAAAGGLGVAAVMIAKAVGANVIGTVGSEEKRTVIEGLLRDESSCTILPGNGVVRYDVDGWEKDVIALTKERRGVDVVFDTVGLVEKSIRCSVFGGRIVVVGFVGRGDGKNGTMEQVAMNRILLKGIRLMGYRYGESARRDPQEAVSLWQGFDELVNASKFEPVVYRHYKGIESVPTALQDLASRKAYGKIVIEVSDEDRDIGGEDDQLETSAALQSTSSKL